MTYAKGRGLEGLEGPNDMRHIVWALGEPFLSFLFILFDINEIFIVSIGYIYDIREKERVGGLGMTKWAQTMPDTSFGPQVSFFFSFFVLFDTDQIFIDIECKLHSTRHQEIGSLRRDTSRASGQLPLPPPLSNLILTIIMGLEMCHVSSPGKFFYPFLFFH